jgi:hypothetical protein
MISEFTLNEYKAFKHIVKHKRVNRVFSKLGAETTLQPRSPGPNKKTPTLGAVGSSVAVAPPKPRKKRASRREKYKEDAGDASSPAVCPLQTKYLESSKRKRKASESTFEAEIQVTSNLAELGRKKAKKAVKKVSVVIVQRVPSAFYDEEMEDEPRLTGFFSCIYCTLRSGVHRVCTPSSENEFVDVKTFSDATLEAQAAPEKLVAIASSKA